MFALVEPSVFTTIIFSEIGPYAVVGAITPLAMIIFISCGSIPRLVIWFKLNGGVLIEFNIITFFFGVFITAVVP